MVLFAFGFNGFGQIKTENNKKQFISEPTLLEVPKCTSGTSDSFSNKSSKVKDLKITWNYILAVFYNSDVFMWKSRNGCKSNCNILDEKFHVAATNWNSAWTFNTTTNKLKITDSSFDCFKAIMLHHEEGNKLEFSGIHITDDEKHLLFLSDENLAYKSITTLKDVYSTGFMDIEPLKVFPERPMRVIIKKVSCGKHHVLLLTRIGTVLSFGNGNQGQLGLGSVESRSGPGVVEALGGLHVIQVSAGGWHSLALTDSGDIYSWGWNNFGQLGLPCDKSLQFDNEENVESHREVINIQMVPTCLNVPDEVQTVDEGIVNISPSSGSLITLAGNDRNPSHSLPREDLSNICFVEIASGSRHSLGLSENNEVFSWGWNKYGQLGYEDSREIQDHPKRIDFFNDKTVTRVHAGAWNSVVEAADY